MISRAFLRTQSNTWKENIFNWKHFTLKKNTTKQTKSKGIIVNFFKSFYFYFLSFHFSESGSYAIDARVKNIRIDGVCVSDDSSL